MFGDLTTVAGRDMFIVLWVWPFLSLLCLGGAVLLMRMNTAGCRPLEGASRILVVTDIIFGLVALGVSVFFWGMKLFWD